MTFFPGPKEGKSLGTVNEVIKKEATKAATEYLQRLGKLCNQLGYEPELKLLLARPMISEKQAILAYTEKSKPDVLVVGSRGMGAFGRMFLGSTSDYLVHNCKSAVMVVRDKDIETLDNTNKEASAPASIS
uniref:UspA domain-containing protein n=2 Tax=Lotharella globosa TaxID=91324 RepID=A0A6V3PJ30_9EUKA|mmetsp:Transcript_5935/g.11760  ORF Transcript_5935/g.11760 Transcript_5935/m.11760 type:complete len:131 (-) Transcript_5935:147-539(-)